MTACAGVQTLRVGALLAVMLFDSSRCHLGVGGIVVVFAVQMGNAGKRKCGKNTRKRLVNILFLNKIKERSKNSGEGSPQRAGRLTHASNNAASIPVSGSFGVSSDVGTSPAASWSITSLPVFFCQSPKREEKEQIGLFLCSRRMLGLLDRGESESQSERQENTLKTAQLSTRSGTPDQATPISNTIPVSTITPPTQR